MFLHVEYMWRRPSGQSRTESAATRVRMARFDATRAWAAADVGSDRVGAIAGRPRIGRDRLRADCGKLAIRRDQEFEGVGEALELTIDVRLTIDDEGEDAVLAPHRLNARISSFTQRLRADRGEQITIR
jgi:hypothetical protein